MRRMGRIKFLLWAVIFSCAVIGRHAHAAGEAGAGGIIVSAAASLTNVMQDLGKDFQDRYPGEPVIFNFGATGDLLAQMSQGAPVDVFASASVQHMDQAAAKGLIRVESRINFAANTLVLAKPAGGAIEIAGLEGLTRPEVERIGIGKPETVPAGQYAKAALVAAGLWNRVENKLIYGSSVRQVLDYLRRGEVDAGLIYATDAKVAGDTVRVIGEVAGTTVLYPVAITATARNKEKSALFLSYLATGPARAILTAHGFKLP